MKKIKFLNIANLLMVSMSLLGCSSTPSLSFEEIKNNTLNSTNYTFTYSDSLGNSTLIKRAGEVLYGLEKETSFEEELYATSIDGEVTNYYKNKNNGLWYAIDYSFSSYTYFTNIQYMFKNYDLDVEEFSSKLKRTDNTFNADNYELTPNKQMGSDNIIEKITIVTDGNRVTKFTILDEGITVSYQIENYDNTEVTLPKLSYTYSELFEAAFTDVKVLEESDVQTLVCLTEDDDYAEFDSNGLVKLCTIHSSPSLYVEGQDITLPNTKTWTFTEKELAEHIFNVLREAEGEEVDLEKHLYSALGINPNNSFTHISCIYTDLSNVKRPSYDIDPTKQITGKEEFSTTDENYISWFNETMDASYNGEDKKLWTRLGYTYNWIEPYYTYGLTEFIIDEGATSKVEYTKSIGDFIDYIYQTYKGKF